MVENDRLVNKAVRVGFSNGLNTQIVSGLSDGATVALDYDETMSPEAGGATEDMRSPFAPKRPGENKNKK